MSTSDLPFEPGHVSPATPSGDALLFLARGMDLWVRSTETASETARDSASGALEFPRLADTAALADGVHFLGRIGGTDLFAGALREGAEPEAVAAGLVGVPGRTLHGQVSAALFDAAGRALTIAEWDRNHRFCGRCATPTLLDPNERVRRCPHCRTPFYPRISPAVIVLVRKGPLALLARNAHFPRDWYSTVAGFVDAGESLEQTVHREVREEVGVEVKDLCYFGSQPWPFGRSLMLGFTAQWAGGEIRVDGTEIADAQWFRHDALPLVPPPLSIARQLIDAWVAELGAR